jgi:hypothetical protein
MREEEMDIPCGYQYNKWTSQQQYTMCEHSLIRKEKLNE